MYKGLFITHDVSMHGSPTSLGLLISKFRGISVDMLVEKHEFQRYGQDFIRKRFSETVQNIFNCRLIADYGFTTTKLRSPSLRKRVAHVIDTQVIRAIIKKGGYDFIHLNSLVLYPLIHKAYPFIIHVREIYRGYHKDKVSRALQNARGVIFISEYTKEPFRNVPLKKSVVLQNPFDMTNVRSVKADDLDERLAVARNKGVVFSIIGNMYEEKGIDFVIESFTKVQNENTTLLVVGNGSEEYLDKCRLRAAGDKRIIFYGDEENIDKIYSISDYIIRGESYPCIGRTMYEGLYGGCSVIIPGSICEGKNIFDYDKFKQKIHFYTPRNHESLVSVLNMAAFKKVTKETYESNLDDCAAKFYDFIRCSLEHKDK
ncbi:MAG: glycosyltransferase [Candidatus Omnitrophica bacterium]|nr:glycosyltransferase [Candidatus Omnitrophota bacterium]